MQDESRGWHPLWLVLTVSVWIAGLGNLPLWHALARLAPFDHPAAYGFAAGFGLLIAAILSALASLLAWRSTLKSLLLLLLLISAVGVHFMLAYGIVIDPTMMTNVVESDALEAADLLDWRLLMAIVLLALPPAWLVVRWPLRFQRWPRQLAQNAGVALLALGVAGSAFLAISRPFVATMRNHKEVRYLINPLNSIYSLGVLASRPFSPAARAFTTLGADAQLGGDYREQLRPPLLVLVIGETARSDHFGLNGYPRDTSPELTREDVASFRNVRSCGTSTATSVPCLFSHLGRVGFGRRNADYENLLDVLQRSGLAVLWLENQSGCKGVCDRVPNASTRAAVDPELCPGGLCQDLILLEGLEARLASLPTDARGRGVVLVMHPMGSHGPAYYKRSPSVFKPFQPECESTALQDCSSASIVNAYDNSIRYTDHLLASTVRWLKAHAAEYDGAMLYLSDHGESLGENNLFLHGMPYGVAPDAQTHVPWIQWLSSGFANRAGIAPACLQSLVEQPISHDHLFHAVLGLMDVQSEVYQPGLDPYFPCRSAKG